MECPVCETQLNRHDIELPDFESWDTMHVDICENGCGGIWFENHEFEKVNYPHDVGGEAIVEIAASAPRDVERKQQHSCPECDDIIMRQYFYSMKREVEVDECGKCGGIWLDGGELAELRTLFDSKEERNEAFQSYFSNRFKPQLQQHSAEQEKGFLQHFVNLFGAREDDRNQ
jgi:Zn-finger nucleic acid-binding protein